jgi:cytochrome c553
MEPLSVVSLPPLFPMKKTSFVTVLLFLGASLAGSAAEPRDNWVEYCVKCHGPAGKGNTKLGKELRVRNLTLAKVQAEFTDEQALEAIKQGLMNEKGKVTMKPIENLSDEERKALVRFVRGLKR